MDGRERAEGRIGPQEESDPEAEKGSRTQGRQRAEAVPEMPGARLRMQVSKRNYDKLRPHWRKCEHCGLLFVVSPSHEFSIWKCGECRPPKENKKAGAVTPARGKK